MGSPWPPSTCSRKSSTSTEGSGIPPGSDPIRNLPSSELFHAAGLEPSDPAWADRLRLTTLDGEGRPLSTGAPSVALYDGRLLPVHAELFERMPPISLLARGEDGVPAPWSLRVLDALWSGRSGVLGRLEGIPIHQRSELRTSGERVVALATNAGVGRAVAESAADVAYELAANALLDAPADDGGAPKYAHRRDEPELRIAPEDAVSLEVGIEGGRMFLGVSDRFGRLRPASFARTLAGLSGRARVDQSGGGAGLGLRRIIVGSSMLAARVVPGLHSEVWAVIDLGENRRRASSPKSILFRIERG